MKAVVIGGTGHVGTYLVPRLVRAGYDVVSVSRGTMEPYTLFGEWKYAERVLMDREEEEKNGTFGKKIAALKPDIVIDMISFKLESTQQLVDAIKGQVCHYLYTSSIRAHGLATVVPAPEDIPRRPFTEYGIQKAKTEAYLHNEYRTNGFPETVVMPGHITGPGWVCVNPCGNFDPLVFERIAHGEEIYIPHYGMEALAHVHADDVAQVFMNSILHRSTSLGESFHAVAAEAITLRGYADAMALWFGRESNVKLLPWKQWCETVKDQTTIYQTDNHITHSNVYSIEKGRRLIDYRPRYTVMEAVGECVTRLIEDKVIVI